MKTLSYLALFLLTVVTALSTPKLIIHLDDGTTKEVDITKISEIDFESVNKIIAVWLNKPDTVCYYNPAVKNISFYNLDKNDPVIIFGMRQHKFSEIDSMTLESYNEIEGVKYNKATIRLTGFIWRYEINRSSNNGPNHYDYSYLDTTNEDITIESHDGARIDTKLWYEGMCACMGNNYPLDQFYLCSASRSEKEDNLSHTTECAHYNISLFPDTINQSFNSISVNETNELKYSTYNGNHTRKLSAGTSIKITHPVLYSHTNDSTITALIPSEDIKNAMVFYSSYHDLWGGSSSSGTEDRLFQGFEITKDSKIVITISK